LPVTLTAPRGQTATSTLVYRYRYDINNTNAKKLDGDGAIGWPEGAMFDDVRRAVMHKLIDDGIPVDPQTSYPPELWRLKEGSLTEYERRDEDNAIQPTPNWTRATAQKHGLIERTSIFSLKYWFPDFFQDSGDKPSPAIIVFTFSLKSL
jgi:hypothetical protein